MPRHATNAMQIRTVLATSYAIARNVGSCVVFTGIANDTLTTFFPPLRTLCVKLVLAYVLNVPLL